MSTSYDALQHGTGYEFYAHLPDNLALYVGDRRFVVHLATIKHMCGQTEQVFLDRSDRKWEYLYGHIDSHEGKRYWYNPWNMIGSFCKRYGLQRAPQSGLQQIFVAEGKYRDASLYTLFKTLSTAELKTVGTVDAPAVAPLDRLAAKEAKLQEEMQLLDQMKAHVERLRAYPADLSAQITAAKVELVVIEARVEELRLLEATLVEKRKILQAPELKE
jgi:hypothetical protein